MKFIMKKIAPLLILSLGLVLGSCSNGGDERVASDEMADVKSEIVDVRELMPTISEPLSGGSASMTYTYENTMAAQLGGGYNPISESITGVKCVVDRNGDAGMIEKGSVTSQSSFEFVDNTQELMEKLKITASASMNLGMYSGSISSKIVEKTNINTRTVAAIARYDVAGKYRTFNDAVLSDPIKGLTSDAIYDSCGNYFLNSVTSGASLVAIIRIQSTDISQKQAIKTSLQASYGGKTAEGGTGFDGDFSKKLKQYNATVDVYATGCSAIKPATNFDEYLELLKDFADVTQKCMDDPKKGVMDMTSTATFLKIDSILAAAGKSVKDVGTQTKAMEDLFDFRMEYKKLDSDIDHVLDNNYLYDIKDKEEWDIIKPKLEAAKINIATYIKRIEDRIEDCMGTTLACGFLDEANLAKADYPSELRAAVVPPIKDFYPASCKEIPNSGSVTDGSHTLYFHGNNKQPFTAYCTDLNIKGKEAKTYLIVSESTNYAEFINYWQWKENNKSVYWPNLKTSYAKVRLNDEGDDIYPYDATFARSVWSANKKQPSNSVKPFPLGGWMEGPANALDYVPYGCIIGSRRAGKTTENKFTAKTMIDLTGTPFAFGYHQNWDFEGSSLENDVVIDPDRKTATIQVGGDNGYGRPAPSQIPLEWVGL